MLILSNLSPQVGNTFRNSNLPQFLQCISFGLKVYTYALFSVMQNAPGRDPGNDAWSIDVALSQTTGTKDTWKSEFLFTWILSQHQPLHQAWELTWSIASIKCWSPHQEKHWKHRFDGSFDGEYHQSMLRILASQFCKQNPSGDKHAVELKATQVDLCITVYDQVSLRPPWNLHGQVRWPHLARLT